MGDIYHSWITGNLCRGGVNFTISLCYQIENVYCVVIETNRTSADTYYLKDVHSVDIVEATVPILNTNIKDLIVNKGEIIQDRKVTLSKKLLKRCVTRAMMSDTNVDDIKAYCRTLFTLQTVGPTGINFQKLYSPELILCTASAANVLNYNTQRVFDILDFVTTLATSNTIAASNAMQLQSIISMFMLNVGA